MLFSNDYWNWTNQPGNAVKYKLIAMFFATFALTILATPLIKPQLVTTLVNYRESSVVLSTEAGDIKINGLMAKNYKKAINGNRLAAREIFSWSWIEHGKDHFVTEYIIHRFGESIPYFVDMKIRQDSIQLRGWTKEDMLIQIQSMKETLHIGVTPMSGFGNEAELIHEINSSISNLRKKAEAGDEDALWILNNLKN